MQILLPLYSLNEMVENFIAAFIDVASFFFFTYLSIMEIISVIKSWNLYELLLYIDN